MQKLAAIALLPGLLLVILIIWIVCSTLNEAAQIANVVGGIGTLLLSFLGAIAGLWWFFRRQPLVPKLNIEQEVTVLPGPNETHLLQVFARLENVGELPVTITAWRIWACPLDPLPKSVEEVLLKNSACVDRELQWESCAGRKIERHCFDEIRVRAGEIQETIASVLVRDRDVRTVRIHSFFPHPELNTVADEDRGWTRYSIVTLQGEETMSENQRRPQDDSLKSGFRDGEENYREPTPRHREPATDETYREPQPRLPTQESDKK